MPLALILRLRPSRVPEDTTRHGPGPEGVRLCLIMGTEVCGTEKTANPDFNAGEIRLTWETSFESLLHELRIKPFRDSTVNFLGSYVMRRYLFRTFLMITSVEASIHLKL